VEIEENGWNRDIIYVVSQPKSQRDDELKNKLI